MDNTRMFGKYKLVLEQDDFPESPREWDNNFGNMICFHSRYHLGDKHHWRDPDEFLNGLCELVDSKWESYLDWLDNAGYQKARRIVLSVEPTIDPSKIHERATGLTYHWLQKRRERTLDKHYVMLPLYLYDHSGITMNTTGFSCRWDSGQVGWIYVSRENLLREFNKVNLSKKIRQTAEQRLRGEVHEYDQYLTGDVWQFTITDTTGAADEEGCVDSCGGYYGRDCAEQQALESLLLCDRTIYQLMDMYDQHHNNEVTYRGVIERANREGWLEPEDYEFYTKVLDAFVEVSAAARREEMQWRCGG